MPLDAITDTLLTTETMTRLRSCFARRDHHPSPKHWEAIEDIVATLSNMANGICQTKVFLSALDPGVGKSSAVAEFAAALTGSASYQHVGMIVCVGRIVEAESIAESILKANPSASIAILTSDDDANGLSTAEDAGSAQVLITTQQRIELATEGRGFEECDVFFYQGSPRAVRAWDEAWLPGVIVTASRGEILEIVGTLERYSRPCADAVVEFATRWGSFEDGEPVAVPDFEGLYDVSFQAIRWQCTQDDKRRILANVAALSGRTARIRSDGKRGIKVLTYKDTMPDDLAPLIVLDASGRVRETYKFIESHRGGLKQLRQAAKDYAPLTVRIWERAGSKSGWETGGAEMITAIVETIREKPNEEWLVVAHKPTKDIPDVHKKITRQVPGVTVNTITWGQHMASNDYSECPNVILAGTLFMTPSHYTALTHLSQDRSVEHSLAPAADVRTIELGEHANLILQAVCRGRVRKSDGDRCLPMTAYIIASSRSGIPGIIKKVFPGCSVETWREVKIKTPKAITRALKFVDQKMRQGVTGVTNTEIRNHLGLDGSNFRDQVKTHKSWSAGLQKFNLVQYDSAGRVPGGVRLATAV